MRNVMRETNRPQDPPAPAGWTPPGRGGDHLAQPSQASTLSWFSSIHFAAASSGDILSAVM